jgi:hypothetical protein
MTTTTHDAQATSTSARGAATWSILARIEIARYARRPGFIVGTFLTYAVLLPYLDAAEPVDELSMIAPAALIGLAGITTSAQRVWASDRCAAAAGSTPIPEATRTIAHLAACVLPFLAGLGFVAISFARHLTHPAPADGYTALMSDAWVASVWFGLGAVSCFGGPILGVVIARATHWRAAPIVASVGVVATAIVFQGLFEPLRRIRVFMPWTYWGGPFGIDGDPQRSIVLTGSPQWWVVYLVTLCAIGALVAVGHDPDLRDRRSDIALGVLVAVAVTTCLLAMWTGTADTITNPLPGSGTSWGG